MNHDLVLSFGYIGSVIGVVMVVPQIVRILRYPTLTGVSPSSWAITTVACLTWLTYGIRTSSMPQIPGNILLIAGAVAVVLLAPAEISRRKRAALLLLASAAVLAIAWLVPAHVTGYVAFVVGLGANWPQLYDSVGNWKAGINSGVSVTTWVLRVASQVCWLTYAVLTGDVPVAVSAGLLLSTAALLVVLEVAARSAALPVAAAPSEAI